MCTSSCQSSYGKDFEYLRKLTTVGTDNSIYKKLEGKKNLQCVQAFLASIASKVR